MKSILRFKGLFGALLLLCFSLFGTVFGQELSLQERMALATRVKVVENQPMNVSVNPFAEGEKILSGKITIDDLPRAISKIDFSVGSGASIEWKDALSWDDGYFKTSGRVRIPFSFDLSEKGIVGEKTLSITVYDLRDQTISFKSQGLNFEKFENEVALSEISNLRISQENELVSATFDFLNNKGDGNFVGKITVFQDEARTEKLFEQPTVETSVLKSGTHSFSLNFSKPDVPSIYYLEAQVFQAEKAETGILKQAFTVEGEYAVIENVQVAPKQYLVSGDSVFLDLIGFTNLPNSDLKARVKVRNSELPGNDSEILNEEFPVIVDEFGYFTEEFSFKTQKSAEQLWGTVEILQGRNVLGETQFETKRFLAPEASIIDVVKDPKKIMKLPGGKKLMILLGLIGIALVFILFVTFLVRVMRKGRLFVLLLSLIFTGQVSAAIVPDNLMFDYYRTTGDLSQKFDWAAIGGTGSGPDETKLSFGETFDTAVVVNEDLGSGSFGPDLTIEGESFTVANQGKFFFQFDLKDSDLGTTNPAVERRKYRIRDIYLLHQSSPANNIVYSPPSTVEFTINNAPPKAYFRLEDSLGTELKNLAEDYSDNKQSGETLEEFVDRYLNDDLSEYFTNEAVTATVYCGYVSGANTGLATGQGDTAICGDAVAKDNAHLQQLKIRGNFCTDSDTCDDTGARQYLICDLTGNCSINDTDGDGDYEVVENDTNLEIVQYDVTPPTFTSLEISNKDLPSDNAYKRTDSSPLAALDNYLFKILQIRDAEESALGDPIDDNGCGVPTTTGATDYDDFFFEKEIDINGTLTKVCHPKKLNCAIDAHQRGVKMFLEKDINDDWVPVSNPSSIVCAQECEAGEQPAFCNATDKGLGLKRCCSADCTNTFPLVFPSCF